MRQVIDRDWYKPKLEIHDGYASVKIGDYRLVEGVFNVRWPDGHHEALRVKMKGITLPNDRGGYSDSVVPYLVLKYHGTQVFCPVWMADIEMGRIK